VHRRGARRDRHRRARSTHRKRFSIPCMRRTTSAGRHDGKLLPDVRVLRGETFSY
jgi:hypothetical protein